MRYEASHYRAAKPHLFSEEGVDEDFGGCVEDDAAVHPEAAGDHVERKASPRDEYGS